MVTKDTSNAADGNFSRTLMEDDIAGASLNGRDPSQLTIPMLKRWLQCRDTSTKGKKSRSHCKVSRLNH